MCAATPFFFGLALAWGECCDIIVVFIKIGGFTLFMEVIMVEVKLLGAGDKELTTLQIEDEVAYNLAADAEEAGVSFEEYLVSCIKDSLAVR